MTLRNHLVAAADRLATMDPKPELLGSPDSVQEILEKLRTGQTWLREQHFLFMADDPRAVSGEKFSNGLARWDALERVFRCSKYTGCIWGENQHCPEDSPVNCDACVTQPETEPEQLVGQLEMQV